MQHKVLQENQAGIVSVMPLHVMTMPTNNHLSQYHKKALVIVIALNAAMFVVGLSFGLLSGSTALLSDSLDMFGDAVTYGLSLWVVGMGVQWKYRSALVKASVMILLGAFVIIEAIDKTLNPVLPDITIVIPVALLALGVNSFCLYLLNRHRKDDINMRSAMACSYTDIFANIGVLVAALLVWFTGYHWPDLIVGCIVALLFLRAALAIIKECVDDNRRQNILPELNMAERLFTPIKILIKPIISYAVSCRQYLLSLIKNSIQQVLGIHVQQEQIQSLQAEIAMLKNQLSSTAYRPDESRKRDAA
ncbi:MAG: cation diffusion facilitator family transporter [Cellvibrionaceae bacterium]